MFGTEFAECERCYFSLFYRHHVGALLLHLATVLEDIRVWETLAHVRSL